MWGTYYRPPLCEKFNKHKRKYRSLESIERATSRKTRLVPGGPSIRGRRGPRGLSPTLAPRCPTYCFIYYPFFRVRELSRDLLQLFPLYEQTTYFRLVSAATRISGAPVFLLVCWRGWSGQIYDPEKVHQGAPLLIGFPKPLVRVEIYRKLMKSIIVIHV